MADVPHSEIAGFIARQQDAAFEAAKRKGQKATNKPSRAVLEQQYTQMRLALRMGNQSSKRTCFITTAYPPSTLPLTQLKPIFIADLRLETCHSGRVLIVRTCAEPVRLIAVQTIIEDARNDVDRLSVYNESPLATASQILPNDTVFAIKEPYYKATVDGSYSVRIDHPSDMVLLRPGNPHSPIEFELSRIDVEDEVASLKASGNEAYRSGDYRTAIDHYTSALLKCDDRVIVCDLLRNRSIANHLIRRFERAADDAIGSLLCPSDVQDMAQLVKANTKALFRAGRARYALADFEHAAMDLGEAQKLSPDDEDVLREVARTQQRLNELGQGYDTLLLFKEVAPHNQYLDHASLLGNIEIRNSGSRGRGLFATQTIPAGGLVFAEKAFDLVFASAKTTQVNLIVNANTNRGRVGPQATLLWSLIEKLRYNPMQAEKFLQLYDGGYVPKCNSEIVDGAASIDSFQVQAIIEYNAFGCPNLRSGDESVGDERMSSIGVWMTASYANHACCNNANRSFCGDFMLVHAVRDIAAGEEITMCYVDTSENYSKAIERLADSWGFRCDCEVCKIENSIEPRLRDSRSGLLEEALDVMFTNPQTESEEADPVAIERMETIYQQLVKTYPARLYTNRPRIGLIAASMWLCQANGTSNSPAKAIESAHEVLRNLSIGVQIHGDKVCFDRQFALVRYVTVNAAMFAVQAYDALCEPALSKAFKEFAELNYRALVGDLTGFNRRYGITATASKP